MQDASQPPIDARALLRIQAHANRLANYRLHTAMSALSLAELEAPRTGFFPTLIGTLNHILEVDGYYIGVLHGDADIDSGWWDRFIPAATLADLARRQRESDERLIAWFGHQEPAALGRPVQMPRQAGRVQTDRAAHVLQHLFMHQTHHRGQVHAMLSGTAVTPPQLDEFLMPSEPHLRSLEMAASGLSEAAVYGR